MTKTGLPELEFPTNKAGEFVPQEELQKNDLETQELTDAEMIDEISYETKAAAHLIKKVDGVWMIGDLTVQAYKEFWADDRRNQW